MGRTALKAIQAAAGSAGGDFYPYTIDNSVRFASGSDKLTRTNSGSGSTKGCFSMWVKRSNLNPSAVPELIGTSTSEFYFANSTQGGGVYYPDTIGYYEYFSSNYQGQGSTSINTSSNYGVFRDTSAWYHIFLVWDTTLATGGDRYQIWINNQRFTLTGVSTVAQNTLARWFYTGDIVIGNNSAGTKPCLSYLAEVVGVEGTAYAPTDFAENKNGVWVPKNVSGLTFGTNGFYLKFDNAGSLGTDSSGNGNNFTVSGLTSSDQMSDTPTNNFATLNPLSKGSSITLSEGNLKATCSTGVINNTLSTLATPLSDAKVYWELTINAVSSSFRMEHGGKSGYEPGTNYLSSANPGFSATFHETAPTNTFYFNVNGSNQTTLSSITPLVANDVVQYAYDPDTGKIWVGRNGTWLNSGNPSAGTGNVGTLTTGLAYNVGSMLNGNLGAQTVTYNFGQTSFAYTPPTGFVALSTANLPEPTIGPNSDTTSGENFNTVLYTGNGTSQNVTGFGFNPDMVWHKGRSVAYSHSIVDVIRGDSNVIFTNTTDVEQNPGAQLDLITDGATVTYRSANLANNQSGATYVIWAWKGNGSGVTNTDGSITSTVSANTDAGISIVTYTGTGSAGTIGHGLGAVPKLIIIKNRVSTVGGTNWQVYHASLGNGKRLFLNLTNAENTSSIWNNTTPTSSVFSLSAGSEWNQSSSDTYVAYCFAEIEGFSKFGSWAGASGSEFIYTGFRPAFVLVKRTNVSGWYIFDSKRGYNGGINSLQPNTDGADAGPWATQFNLYSNGFEDNNFVGDAGTTIIYMAFAENPFKYSNAR